MYDIEPGLDDKAIGDSIREQAEIIECASNKQKLLKELRDQLSIVAEEAEVETDNKNSKSVKVKFTAEQLSEEIQALVEMEGMAGDIHYDYNNRVYIGEYWYYYSK